MTEEIPKILGRVNALGEELFRVTLPQLDVDFEEFLAEKLSEAKSLFQKQPEEEEAKSENDDPNETFPVLLPQTPRVKKPKSRLAKDASPPDVSSSPPDSSPPMTAGKRPTRAASKTAQSLITKSVQEHLNTKKRRPTSTQSSLTKKAAALKITSENKVRFEHDVQEPKDKKRRVTARSTNDDSKNSDRDMHTPEKSDNDEVDAAPEEAMETDSQEDTENEALSPESEKDDNVTPKQSSRQSSTLVANQEENEEEPVAVEVVKQKSVDHVKKQALTEPTEQPMEVEQSRRRTTRNATKEEPAQRKRMTRSVSVQKLDASQPEEKKKEDALPAKKKLARSVSAQNLDDKTKDSGANKVEEEAIKLPAAKHLIRSVQNQEASQPEDTLPAKKKLARSVSTQKLDDKTKDSGANKVEEEAIKLPAAKRLTRSVQNQEASQPEEKKKEDALPAKKKLTRSVSTQKLDDKTNDSVANKVEEEAIKLPTAKQLTRSTDQEIDQHVSPPAVTKLVSGRNQAEEAASVIDKKVTRSNQNVDLEKGADYKDATKPNATAARRLTRSISAQQLGDNKTKGPSPRRIKTPDVPKIKLMHPSQSGMDDETLDADAIERGAKKFKTLPRVGVPKTSLAMKKAVSTASIRQANNKLPVGMKAPSTSNLITAAKLSANKMGGATRRFTPYSPAKLTNESLASRLRSEFTGGLQSSPVKVAKMGGGKSGNIVSNVTSFLPGRPQRTAKLTAEQVSAQKAEELKKKKEKEDEALRRKDEIAEAKREAKRKENEARQRRVMQSRQALEASKQSRLQQEKEAKEKLEVFKQAQLMAEERRRKEQQQREEEEKRRKIEDECRKKAEEERLRVEEEQRVKANEQRKKEAKEIKTKLEAERKAQLAKEIAQQKQRLVQLQAKVESGHNSTYTKGKEDLNKTYNKDDAQGYEITPARHELPPEVLNDPDNYDIAGLRSDEDTDDEDHPRKKPAKWSVGTAFKTAIFEQAYYPPDVDHVFFLQEASVKLEEIFPEVKRRFYNRTSSAVWDKAPNSHKFDKV